MPFPPMGVPFGVRLGVMTGGADGGVVCSDVVVVVVALGGLFDVLLLKFLLFCTWA